MARRLVRLGLAQSRSEVVARVGCTPGGLLDVNDRLAKDKQSVLLWVLSVTVRRGTLVHLSLHPDQQDAEAARDRLIPSVEEDRDWREKWYWTIAQRVVGECSVRDEVHGDFHPHLGGDSVGEIC